MREEGRGEKPYVPETHEPCEGYHMGEVGGGWIKTGFHPFTHSGFGFFVASPEGYMSTLLTLHALTCR